MTPACPRNHVDAAGGIQGGRNPVARGARLQSRTAQDPWLRRYGRASGHNHAARQAPARPNRAHRGEGGMAGLRSRLRSRQRRPRAGPAGHLRRSTSWHKRRRRCSGHKLHRGFRHTDGRQPSKHSTPGRLSGRRGLFHWSCWFCLARLEQRPGDVVNLRHSGKPSAAATVERATVRVTGWCGARDLSRFTRIVGER